MNRGPFDDASTAVTRPRFEPNAAISTAALLPGGCFQRTARIEPACTRENVNLVLGKEGMKCILIPA